MVTAEDDSDTTQRGPRVGVLLVRAWVEPDQAPTVRARLLTTEDGSPLPVTWATAAGNDAICEELLRWLSHLQECARDPGHGADTSGDRSPDRPGGS